MSDVWLSLSGRGSLHEQVYWAVRDAITKGVCSPGERLPSSRALAGSLGLSRTSTQTAYEQLTAEGHVVTRRGAGTFVAEIESSLGPGRPRAPSRPANHVRVRLSGYASRAIAELPTGFLSLPNRSAIDYDFLYGVPAPEFFRREEWRRVLNSAARRMPFDLSESLPQGHPRLRCAIATHLERNRGVFCEPDQIVVTSGVQQALQLVARVLCSPGDRVILEDPHYPFARATCMSEGLEVEFAEVDTDGINLRTLSSHARRNSRLVHVTPAHQFPMGVVLSYPRRRTLLDWASENDSFIFEDDYDSEYRYEGRPIESLYSLDESGRVLYAGSFSKTLATDLRLGFLVLPENLVDAFRAARWLAGWGNPLLEQAALAEFIEEGDLERHIRRSRKRYGERRSALVNSFETEFGDRATIVGDQTGLHIYVELPEFSSKQTPALLESAAKHGVGIYSAADCFSLPMSKSGLILGYGLLSADVIPRAVERLAEIVDSIGSSGNKET